MELQSISWALGRDKGSRGLALAATMGRRQERHLQGLHRFVGADCQT